MHVPLDTLRTELADLAFELERKGRRDAADVVMLLDVRVQEMARESTAAEGDAKSVSTHPAVLTEKFP